MFNFLNPTAFGLDISDRLIKVTQFIQNKDQLSLFGFASHEVPLGVINKGEIKKTEELAEIIKKTLKRSQPHPIKSKSVVCCLPESKCFIRVVRLPQMSPKEVAEAAGWEAEEQFPFEKEEMYLDWQILETVIKKPEKRKSTFSGIRGQSVRQTVAGESENLQGIDVLLVAASRSLADSYLATLDKAGLIPVALEPESIATTRSLISEKEKTRVILIIDLGQEKTGFIIYERPVIRFTSDIPISGNLLTEAVAKEFKVSFNEAEKIKIKNGLDETKKDGRIIKAISPHLSRLVEKIEQSMAYYSEHFSSFEKNGTVSKIILCGGGANLLGLNTFLSLRLKKKVEIGNPWVRFIEPKSKKLPPLSYDKSLAFATAFGLALRGIQNYYDNN